MLSALRRSGAIVPAGWALYNGMWFCVMAGFGGNADMMWLYGGSIALTELFAGAVSMSKFLHPGDVRHYVLPTRGEAGLLGAVALLFAAVAIAFGIWFWPLCAVSLVLAGWAVVRDHLERHRSSAPS